MSVRFIVFRRDRQQGDEWVLSRHIKKSNAINAARRAYAKRGGEVGVDSRNAEDDELIEEIGIINAETDGLFVEHA